MKFLDEIRMPQERFSVRKQLLITVAIMFMGICMGVFSKFLDGALPDWLYIIDRFLDFHNFLGGFAPWIVIAVCIAVYSHTPIRAAINVFVFFVGMVSSYYIYSNFVSGFFPKSYAMIWVGFTIISPILAFFCWYAKGKGIIAFILSFVIIGVLMNTAFAYGRFYVDIRSWLNIFMLLLGIAVLHKSLKETILMIAAGAVFAILVNEFVPFNIW